MPASIYLAITSPPLKRFVNINEVAESIGSEVLIAMIPAPVQVCDQAQLKYYPRYVNLDDSTKFDLEQPQRVTAELAESLGFDFIDLRPAFESSEGESPYQARNMHWTTTGHRLVAGYLADKLIDDYLETP